MVTTNSGADSLVSYNRHRMSGAKRWTQNTAGGRLTHKLQKNSGRTYHMETVCATSFATAQTPTTRLDRDFHIPSNYILDLSMEWGLLNDSISLVLKAAGISPVSSVQSIQTTQPPTAQRSQLQARESDRFLQISPRPLFTPHRIRKAQP